MRLTTAFLSASFCMIACGQPEISGTTPAPTFDPNADDDGDGVLNGQDVCRQQVGPKENQGCPWNDCKYTIGQPCARLDYTFCNDAAGVAQVMWCPIDQQSALQRDVAESNIPNSSIGAYALYPHGSTHPYLLAAEGTASEEVIVSGMATSYQLTNAVQNTTTSEWSRDMLLLPQNTTGLTLTSGSGKPFWLISTDYDKTTPPVAEPTPPFSKKFQFSAGYSYRLCASPCQL